MVNKFNNKAAMELSLNLIIMLVIGLTVLGLVIGMVTGLLGSATNKFTDKLDETQAAEKEAVLGKSGFFAVGPEKVRISLGDVSGKLFIKINNRYPNDLSFNSTSSVIDNTNGLVGKIDSTTSGTVYLKISSIELGGSGSFSGSSADCQLKFQSAPVTIKSQESQAIVLALGTNKNCNVGDKLFLTLRFTDGNNFDESETINVLIE